MLHPDFRVGFPWTVKNWDKFWKKHAKKEATTTKTKNHSGGQLLANKKRSSCVAIAEKKM